MGEGADVRPRLICRSVSGRVGRTSGGLMASRGVVLQVAVVMLGTSVAS